MKIYFKKLLLSSNRLKNELWIAFGLITLAILVFLGYLFPGVTSWFEARNWLPLIVIIALFIVLLGFLIILQIVEPIIKISNEAKLMAGGSLEREIELAREDEIGELGTALNQMTRQIKDNMEDLRQFSRQTEAINTEINKRIIVLSSLMEISNLIAQKTDLEVILKASVDKCLEFEDMTLGCLILKDQNSGEFKVHMISGEKSEELAEKGIQNATVQLGKGLIGKTILKQNVIIVDQTTASDEEIVEFKKQFSVNNAIIAPITSKGNVFGVLIAGNEAKDYVCSQTEKEVFNLVSKHVAIAVTNDILTREIEKLEVTDHLTGLFNNTFTRKRLNEEIKRAATLQSPCSFVLLSVDGFEKFYNVFGHITAENTLIKVGNVFKDNIMKDDKAARFGDHEFALILPGRNKRQSIKVADDIRKKIEIEFSKENDARRRLTCTGAVAENPIDGVTADELILKCGFILSEAMNKGGNIIAH